MGQIHLGEHGSKLTKFSVIISIHGDDRVDLFENAVKSIVEQSISPDQIIVTVDGEVSEHHKRIIVNCQENTPDITFSKIESQIHIGRGDILAKAVDSARNELVAIMDADDFAYPDRFQRQLDAFYRYPEVDLVGGWVDEIDSETGELYGRREVPEINSEIIKYFKWRNPVNQMTVMFKKSAVISAGNYETHRYVEDMLLWAKMLKLGCRFYNIQKSLVSANAGRAMFIRRRGLRYAKSELGLLVKLHKIGHFNTAQLLANVLLRMPIRFLPVSVLSRIFTRRLRVAVKQYNHS